MKISIIICFILQYKKCVLCPFCFLFFPLQIVSFPYAWDLLLRRDEHSIWITIHNNPSICVTIQNILSICLTLQNIPCFHLSIQNIPNICLSIQNIACFHFDIQNIPSFLLQTVSSCFWKKNEVTIETIDDDGRVLLGFYPS